MTDKEKDILDAIAEAIPKMDEWSKGYFMGYAESMASQKESEEKERSEE